MPTVRVLESVVRELRSELTDSVPRIIQPGAGVLVAFFICCSADASTGTVIIYFAIVVHFAKTWYLDSPLDMLELALLPEHVEVWQEPQVDVQCHELRVLM